jgi:multidrug efflux system membrane fusion protein
VDPGTGTIQVRAVIPNKEKRLYPGLFTRVRIPAMMRRNALIVYERAIGTDLAGKYLYIVRDDNTVELRHVVLGPSSDDMRVIDEGIRPGERYIVDGVQKARPGLPVTPRLMGAPEQNAAPTPDTEPSTDKENKTTKQE